MTTSMPLTAGTRPRALDLTVLCLDVRHPSISILPQNVCSSPAICLLQLHFQLASSMSCLSSRCTLMLCQPYVSVN